MKLKVIIASFALLPGLLAAQDAERPDVLFIAVDDLNDWVGAFGGHPQAKTPNIDRLAARGIAFTNAHSPSVICNPSRTALLTGLRPSTSGVYDNDPDWREEEVFAGLPTLPRHFRDNGYRTFGAGKIFHAHTFGDTSTYEGLNDTTAWDAFYPSLTRQLPDEIRPPFRPANGNTLESPGSRNAFDWSVVVADDMALGDGQVTAWIERQLTAETGSPRFIAAGIYRPHLPWYVPQKYFDMHPLVDIVLPETIPDDLEDVPEIARASYLDSTEWHDWIEESGRWAEAVQAYLASTSYADAMVGRLLDALDSSGRAGNTIIVLWSDHGYHLGEKERWRKMTLWEESTRVPLIIVAPGVSTPGTRSEEAVSLMDLYPTLAELAGLQTPDHVEGQSLVPLIRDPGAVRDEPALTTFFYNYHSVRTERYRYTRYADGSEELYDHETDPNEWENLADRSRYDELKAELARWIPAVNAESLSESPDP